MTDSKAIDGGRLPKAALVPKVTVQYLEALRRERHSLRGWLRWMAYCAAMAVLISAISFTTMNRALKICLAVLAFVVCTLLNERSCKRAAQRQLYLRKRTAG